MTLQARLSDVHNCPPCGMAPLPIAMPGAPTVLVNMIPAARVSDLFAPGVTVAGAPMPPHPIAKGSMTVLICNLPAARVGDLGGCGGPIILGSPNVMTGG